MPRHRLAGSLCLAAAALATTAYAEDDAMTRRRRAVAAPPAALDARLGDELSIELFDGLAVVASLEDRIHRTPTSFSWTGPLRGIDDSWFVMSVHDGVVAADFSAPGLGSYQLRLAADGGYEVLEVSGAASPGCGCGDEPDEVPAPYAPGAVSPPSDGGIAGGSPCAEDGSIIDVLVVHTPAATAGAGGLAAMTALVNLSIDETNLAMSNSLVPITIRLAGIEEVAYTESGFAAYTLEDLIEIGDGELDVVHDLRDQHDADLVTLITNSLDVCGYARIAVGPGPTPMPESAFNIVSRLCATAPVSAFAHEIGHNLGLRHDWAADACDAAALPYGKGYVEPSDAFHTIMATGSTAPAILHFSNPDVLFDGQPTGVATDQPDPANAALSMTLAAQVVANYRSLDCNGNGQCDDDDILLSVSQDCDGNDRPDECDPDRNVNGVPDACDIAGGASTDANANGIPDDAEPAIVFVDASATGAGTGLSWTDAYPDLQAALAIARDSGGMVTQIRVAAGTYVPGPAPHRAATFAMVDGVEILGGFPAGGGDLASRDFELHETILSGDLLGDDGPDFANHDENVITVLTGSRNGETAIIDGFTVRGGWCDPDSSGCWFTPYSGGGGVRIWGGSPTMRHLVVRDNRSTGRGGGLYVVHTSSPSFEGCDFVNNRAIGLYASGAGAHVTTSGFPIEFVDCGFYENVADGGGGGVAAICNNGLYLNCTFSANHAGTDGGAYNNTGACDGSPQFVNCVFRSNSATNFGGVLSSYGAGGPHKEPTFINCTIQGSSANYGAGIACTSAPGVRLINSVIWDSTINGVATGEGPSLLWQVSEVRNSIVEGWSGVFGGTGNSGADPLFVAPGGDPYTFDLRVQPGSPAIDAGDLASLPADAMDLDGDGDTAEALPFDRDGNARVVGGTVDIGAFEDQPMTCPGDTDGNAVVDIDDIVNIILDFNTDGSANGGDVDGSGLVDIDDVVLAILAFGPCF